MNRDVLTIEKALEDGKGILRLEPAWVPRSFCIPGKRLKLHPQDYYAYGADRGGIDERWFASTVKADNGPRTTEFEGLSFVYAGKSERVLLRDAIELAGAHILGPEIMRAHGGWQAFAKFFDNQEPLPHHIHHTDAMAAKIGQKGKPEAYFFPRQLNDHGGLFPYTFFGLNPGTTREEIKECLAVWKQRDNTILAFSKAYKLRLDTGWDVPPGVLHAPGSLLTYEPQRASDVFSMFQNIVWERYNPIELLQKDIPAEKRDDLDFYIDLLDWELNVDPLFFQHRFMPPKPLRPRDEMRAEGYEEYNIVYKSEYFSAKELTVLPGRTVRIADSGPYGAIVIQGHGRIGPLDIESPSQIRFGEMTRDEIFVTAEAARAGVTVANMSQVEDLVMLKHFGPPA